MKEDQLEVDIPLVDNFDQREIIGRVLLPLSFARRIAEESFGGFRYVLGVCTYTRPKQNESPLLFTLTAEPFKQEEEEQSRPLTELEKQRVIWAHKYKYRAPEHWQPKHYRAATKLLEQAIIYYNAPTKTFKINSNVRWGEIESNLHSLRLLEIL